MLLTSRQDPGKCLNKPLLLNGEKPHKFNKIVALSKQSLICIDFIFSVPPCLGFLPICFLNIQVL
jgi:hypothetical protein